MSFFEVKNVYKNFGANRVLKGIDLELDEGQVLAIIGSSGSGKTTLLRCINFLEIPDKAEIYLGGENIFSVDNLDKVNENLQSANQDESSDSTADIAKADIGAENLDNSKESGADMINSGDKDTTDKKAKAKVKPVKISKDKKKQIAQQRLKFGMVFQSFNLFPHYNVLKNLTLAARLKYDKGLNPFEKYFSSSVRTARKQAFKDIEKRAISLLQRVGLGEKLKAYPCELSGGQQQRVAIARALILQPEILCFDEPTSALDPELTREVLKVIKDLKKDGHTMIVVTHEMEFARKVADKVIFMADGIIEEQGAPEEVFGNPQSPKTKAFLQESEKSIDED
ncbi:MAG: amino acid ABC transporter ATP-binding protein [Clostridia bacterium]|nr:amino acid ABC transporter ATP-binding protein [Clostridia bacterium]